MSGAQRMIVKPEFRQPGLPGAWTWALVAVGGAGSALQQGAQGPPAWVGAGLTVVGMVGLGRLGHWAEARYFALHVRRPLVVRLALGWLTPPLAMVVLAVVLGLLSGALSINGAHLESGPVKAWLTQPLVFLALWVASASVGSTLVLSINHLISRLVRGFRARVTIAVLSLLAFSTAVSGVVLAAASAFLGAVGSVDLSHSTLDLGDQKLTGDALREAITGHPVLTALGFFALGLLVTVPAAVSASFHLAEAVMERLRPLSRALVAVGQGERALAVEEAGSSDFVELAQRFNAMVEALARSERMERAFGVYVSGHVLERIRAQHGEAAIPASLREASVFFADIRGFTSLSERLSPEAVVAFLNRYFARVVEVVDRHQGYLNKFIGDAVVVVFNGPVDQPDHAARALACALDLQAEVKAMNAAQAFPEVGELRIGVGVATGPMVCGNIGSTTQMEYTVIGDTVNLSARLTSHAGPGEVWASEATVAHAPPGLHVEPLPPLKVKGKEQPVTPSRVRRDRS